MASKSTAHIPRFLLPQYSPMWRPAVRSPIFLRAINSPDVLGSTVRYASKKAMAAKVSRKTAPTKKTQLKSELKARSTTPEEQPTVAVAPAAAAIPDSSAAPKPPPTAAPKTIPPMMPEEESSPPTTKTQKQQQPSATEFTKKDSTSSPSSSPTVPDPSKPIVLEKPERFNPPSHGSRLPRSRPKHYGGATTADEVKAQSQRSYPGLPPPDNSWAHWFINSRGIHLFITLGTLTSLATFTFVQNFRQNSPYADLIPPISDLPRHPIQYIGAVSHVVLMSVDRESDETATKRDRIIGDVAKRNAYRKAHGMEPASGLFGRKPETADSSPEAVAATEAGLPSDEQLMALAETTEGGKRKKFMGIF